MATTTKLDHAISVSVLGHPVDKHIPRAVQTLSLNEKTHGTCQHLDCESLLLCPFHITVHHCQNLNPALLYLPIGRTMTVSLTIGRSSSRPKRALSENPLPQVILALHIMAPTSERRMEPSRLVMLLRININFQNRSPAKCQTSPGKLVNCSYSGLCKNRGNDG